MKKLLTMLLVVVLAVSLFAGCGNGETASGEPAAHKDTPNAGSGEALGLVGFSSVSLSESIYVMEETALKEIFAGKAEVQTVSCDNDAATQIQHIKNFALMGADLIIINPTDVDALADAIKEAHDAGCKIYINGATTDTLSDEYYECCTVSDEYLCGAYVAMIAKNWIEAHDDQLSAANPNWEIAFLESSLSDETLKRTYGIESILDPYLKDWEGNFVDASGNIVDEAGKVENPAYCQLAVDHFAGVKVEMDQTNSSLNIANILTTNPNTRVFMAFNSLASTQGGQYVVDNYANQLDEFAFFSAGVMGNEADYIVGSVSDTEGVVSVMRGAVQFGVSAAGSDVATSVANTAYAILYGEEGVDYTKKNPDGIAAWWAVEEDWNPEGIASVSHFNILSGATVQAFDPIATLKDENTVCYWNSVDGHIVEEKEEPVAETPAPDAPAAVGPAVPAGEYTFAETIPTGEEIPWTVTLNEDGSAVIVQANEGMGNPTWTAVWTDNGDGTFTTGQCEGDGPQIADFWKDNAITWQLLNDNRTVPVLYSGYKDAVAEFGIPAAGGAPVAAGEYTFMETIPTGEEIQWTVTLNEDGSFVIIQANEAMGNPTWTGKAWVDNGNGTFATPDCEGSGPQIAEFWKNNGITWTDNGDGTVTPVG